MGMIARIHPYLRLMRLHQPTGIWLLFWPCAWGIALASPVMPSPWLLLLFGMGAIIMRGAGCVVNDMLDRKLDAQVERTKNRPLASGEISILQAGIFLGGLLSLGLLILLQLNLPSIMLGCASLVLVGLYPLMKRITYWPQAFLGLTFNWGALMGWMAVTGNLSTPAFVLYGGGVMWTLGYDTIYGHQDKRDDAVVGIKSTALKLGDNTRLWVGGFYAVAWICFVASGVLASIHWGFYIMIAFAAWHFIWQVTRVQLDNPADCMRVFRSNVWLGGIVCMAIMMGRLL